MSGFVGLPPDSSGKKVDTNELTVNSNTVERQNVSLSDPATAAAIANVTPKGTQGSYASQVQDFKDSGRTSLTFVLDDVANVPTTEAVQTMTILKGTVSSSATVYAVSAGKTLRITSMTAMVRATGATLGTVRARLRFATGTLATTSALAVNLMASVPATSGQGSFATVSLSDGFEFPAATNVGISIIGNLTSNNVSVTVTGFEY